MIEGPDRPREFRYHSLRDPAPDSSIGTYGRVCMRPFQLCAEQVGPTVTLLENGRSSLAFRHCTEHGFLLS